MVIEEIEGDWFSMEVELLSDAVAPAVSVTEAVQVITSFGMALVVDKSRVVPEYVFEFIDQEYVGDKV